MITKCTERTRKGCSTSTLKTASMIVMRLCTVYTILYIMYTHSEEEKIFGGKQAEKRKSRKAPPGALQTLSESFHLYILLLLRGAENFL